MNDRLNFGAFIPPFHLPNTQSTHRALHRNVEHAQLLDRLGFDEVWFGEHHSGGAEIIGDPLSIVTYCAPITNRIKLGTGVLSIPWHNPLWVAERLLTVDHLTRGRAMFGFGPGALVTDANMVNMAASEQRPAFEEDIGVLLELLRSTEPVTIETDRYRLREALVQLGPYSEFEMVLASVASPTAPRVAGRHGLPLLCFGARVQGGIELLRSQREVLLASAAEHAVAPAPADRWRIVTGIMHLAETREQAIDEVRYGMESWFDYQQNIGVGAAQFRAAGATFDSQLEWVMATGFGVIGTPDDAVSHIRTLYEGTDRGFGTFVIQILEWARRGDATRSLELFADYVMPEFQYRALDRRQVSADHARAKVSTMTSSVIA